MENPQFKIRSITISGFRAYLDEQPLGLRTGNSLIVFAPNARGKSSLVDALEFIFSKDGTVKRLGEKRSSIQGGRESLYHHDAETRGIKSSVQIIVNNSKDSIEFNRSAKEPETIPEALKPVTDSIKVPFIIRGFELRRFVEEEQPKDRYQSVARWFGFEPLLKTQSVLRTMKLDLKKELESKVGITSLDQEVSKITGKVLVQWNEQKVVEWLHTNYTSKLEPELKIPELSQITEFRESIANRAGLEAPRQNFTQHRNLVLQINSLIIAPDTKELSILDKAINAQKQMDASQKSYDSVKSASSIAIFDQVWTAADKLFREKDAPKEQCPVCDTPFKDSPHGTPEQIQVNLKLKLTELTNLKGAEETFRVAKLGANTTVANVTEKLTAVVTLCESLSISTDKIQKIKNDLSDKTTQTLTLLSEIKNVLETTSAEVELILGTNDTAKPTITWALTLLILDTIISVKKKVDAEVRRKKQLQTILDNVSLQSNLVNTQIKKYVDGLIGTLADLTNFFYQEIQSVSGRVPKVHLVLPSEERQVQNALELLIDFSDNRKGVAPAGYLSDSQVHTLALSLRFAAIKLFNKSFPLLVLDDVVTSYDSDFRSTIAGVLAKHFTGQQVILVTHDEQFFNQLQDHLNQGTWIFKRITKLDPTFGPKYADHRVHDELIEDDHREGKETPNKIRQAEEDWLTDICRDFGVDVRIREVNHPYKYARAELAVALHKFLAEIGRKPPAITEYQNPFLITLQRGTIENMGSHFTDNPNVASSLGDEQKRWGHFKEFRSLFVCSSCKKNRFKRPDGIKIPVCKGCETQFSFTE